MFQRIFHFSDALKFKEEFERCQQQGSKVKGSDDPLSSDLKTLTLEEGGAKEEEDTPTTEEGKEGKTESTTDPE